MSIHFKRRISTRCRYQKKSFSVKAFNKFPLQWWQNFSFQDSRVNVERKHGWKFQTFFVFSKIKRKKKPASLHSSLPIVRECWNEEILNKCHTESVSPCWHFKKLTSASPLRHWFRKLLEFTTIIGFRIRKNFGWKLRENYFFSHSFFLSFFLFYKTPFLALLLLFLAFLEDEINNTSWMRRFDSRTQNFENADVGTQWFYILEKNQSSHGIYIFLRSRENKITNKKVTYNSERKIEI